MMLQKADKTKLNYIKNLRIENILLSYKHDSYSMHSLNMIQRCLYKSKSTTNIKVSKKSEKSESFTSLQS